MRDMDMVGDGDVVEVGALKVVDTWVRGLTWEELEDKEDEGAVRGVNSDCNSITHARAAYLEEEGQVIPETTS